MSRAHRMKRLIAVQCRSLRYKSWKSVCFFKTCTALKIYIASELHLCIRLAFPKTARQLVYLFTHALLSGGVKFLIW